MPQRAEFQGLLRRLWLLAGWMLVAAIICLSLTPRAIEIPVGQGDKIGHALAYGCLMLWFAQIYIAQRSRITVAVAAVALGIGLEFAQLLTKTRMFSVVDMLANGTGVMLGWIVAPPRTRNWLRALQNALARG